MTRSRGVRPTLLAFAAAASIGLVACGDDGDDASPATTAAAAAAPSAPQEVVITASGTPKSHGFTVTPAKLRPGAARLELRSGVKADVDGQLLHFTDERSDREVLAELGKAMNG